MNAMQYQPIRNLPYWKFYYRGSHSHPVLRTVVVTEVKENTFTGYEVREGATTRLISFAPIRTYRKDRIAKIENLRSENSLRQKAECVNGSSLRKLSTEKMVAEGI